MRQAERELTGTPALEAVLRQSVFAHLAFHAEPAPYILAVNIGYSEFSLYFHCAPDGAKIDCLRRDPRVGFAAEAVAETVPAASACGWETRFRSVIGAGMAEVLTADDDKRRGLDVLMAQQARLAGVAWDPADGYRPESLARMVMVRIRIEQLTGKQSKHYLKP